MAPIVHRRDVAISSEEPAMVAAAPPAPPPPPPPAAAPPPPPAMAAAPTAVSILPDKSANGAAQDVLITGSRIEASSMRARPAERTEFEPATDYGPFLLRLQAAVRANDRGAVIGLINFPLRVNAGRASRTYRTAAAVRRDYDRIFTPRVTGAILRQRADQLFVRDLGAMIGNGEVWFDEACANSGCSPAGRMGINAINP